MLGVGILRPEGQAKRNHLGNLLTEREFVSKAASAILLTKRGFEEKSCGKAEEGVGFQK
jgi:hypothetical protein